MAKRDSNPTLLRSLLSDLADSLKKIINVLDPPKPYWGLTFTAEEAGSTIKLMKNGSPSNVSLVTSTDNGETWTPYVIGDTIILNNVGNKVCFAAADGVTNSTFASSSSAYHYFVMTGKIAANGDISSIRKNNKSIVNNISLESMCYFKLFFNCSALTTAPELPTTLLANSCYSALFSGCTSLLRTPKLPAIILPNSCYESMFSNCTSLNTVSEFLATTLNSNSCYLMFFNCTSLNSIEVKFTSWITNATGNWLYNVSSSGTFKCPAALGTDSTITRGASNCPTGWTVVNV